MAVAKVQSKAFDRGFTAATTAAATFSSALTSGSVLVAMATIGANTTIAFSDGTNTWTNIVTRYWANVGYNVALAWAPNTLTTAATVTATFGASGSFGTIAVGEFSGVATTSAVDVSTVGNNNSATTAPVDVSMTTTVAGDLILSAIGSDGGVVSAGSGYTLLEPPAATSCTAMEWQVQSSAGAIAPAFVQATAVQAIIISAALKASGGGPATSSAKPPLIRRASVLRAANF